MNKILWIIDDNKGYLDSILEYGFKNNINIKGFTEGEKALHELKNLIDQDKQIPSAILLNYKLDDEVNNPTYLYGTEVIMEIKDICGKNDIPIPKIIGFSTVSEFNDKMLETGAESILDKNDPNKVQEFISNFK